MKTDPTKSEMLEVIPAIYKSEDGFDIDFEIAAYWFASNYYDGQWSNLYKVLCNSPYSPGRMANFESDIKSDGTLAGDIYFELVNRYFPFNPKQSEE